LYKDERRDTVNKRIMQVRKQIPLNQDDFADALGLTKNFISLIETGKREPSDRTIRDICREFNVNEVWLRTGVGEMFIPKTREDAIAELTLDLLKDEPDSFRNRVVSALAKMSVEEWKVLEKVFDDIVK
jgi:transcriptional regulator with XRE-family HTH domain